MSGRILKGSAWLVGFLLAGLLLLGCSAGQIGKETESEANQVDESSQGAANSEIKVVADLVGREVRHEL